MIGSYTGRFSGDVRNRDRPPAFDSSAVQNAGQWRGRLGSRVLLDPLGEEAVGIAGRIRTLRQFTASQVVSLDEQSPADKMRKPQQG